MPKAFTEDFGGEPQQFRVLIPELQAIQKKCGVGPATVAYRLAHAAMVRRRNPKATTLELMAQNLGDFTVDDVREPVLQGLLGGGMNPNVAGKLVRTWIDDRGFKGLVENIDLALMCISIGFEEPESLGETQAGTKTSPPTPA